MLFNNFDLDLDLDINEKVMPKRYTTCHLTYNRHKFKGILIKSIWDQNIYYLYVSETQVLNMY